MNLRPNVHSHLKIKGQGHTFMALHTEVVESWHGPQRKLNEHFLWMVNYLLRPPSRMWVCVGQAAHQKPALHGEAMKKVINSIGACATLLALPLISCMTLGRLPMSQHN